MPVHLIVACVKNVDVEPVHDHLLCLGPWVAVGSELSDPIESFHLADLILMLSHGRIQFIDSHLLIRLYGGGLHQRGLGLSQQVASSCHIGT